MLPTTILKQKVQEYDMRNRRRLRPATKSPPYLDLPPPPISRELPWCSTPSSSSTKDLKTAGNSPSPISAPASDPASLLCISGYFDPLTNVLLALG